MCAVLSLDAAIVLSDGSLQGCCVLFHREPSVHLSAACCHQVFKLSMCNGAGDTRFADELPEAGML